MIKKSLPVLLSRHAAWFAERPENTVISVFAV
jgi:hypothetical protein